MSGSQAGSADERGFATWGALWERQFSADSLCVKTWAAKFRRHERDFKEG